MHVTHSNLEVRSSCDMSTDADDQQAAPGIAHQLVADCFPSNAATRLPAFPLWLVNPWPLTRTKSF